jgi:hypothetical protein
LAFGRTIEKRYDGVLTFRDFVNLVTGVVAPKLKKAKDAQEQICDAFSVSVAGIPSRSLSTASRRRSFKTFGRATVA